MSGGKFDPGYSFQSSESLRLREERRQHARRDPASVPLARLITPVSSGEDEDGDGKRDCARGEWCSSRTTVTENGVTIRQPERGYQPFCPKDRRLLETDLAQIPFQFVCLAAEIGNPARDGQVIRVPFGPRVLIRIDIDTLMRAVEESLSSWHERVADVMSLSYPTVNLSRRQRPAIAVRNAVRVLVYRADALLALEAQPMARTRRVVTGRDPKGSGTEDIRVMEDLDGTDAGLEVFTLRYLCRAVLGETRARPEELLGVPCRREECDKLALRRAELPSDPEAPVWWSECAVCGDRLTEEEYRDWTRRYARWAEGRTVPALENLPGVA